MSFSDFIRKRDYLKELIEKENTGTARELAERLGFSRRTLFNYLDLLKEEGVQISFCRYRKTYFFQSNKKVLEK